MSQRNQLCKSRLTIYCGMCQWRCIARVLSLHTGQLNNKSASIARNQSVLTSNLCTVKRVFYLTCFTIILRISMLTQGKPNGGDSSSRFCNHKRSNSGYNTNIYFLLHSIIISVSFFSAVSRGIHCLCRSTFLLSIIILVLSNSGVI